MIKPEFLPQVNEATSEDKKTIFSRADSNEFSLKESVIVCVSPGASWLTDATVMGLRVCEDHINYFLFSNTFVC